jgi:hypothetical protein
MNNEELISRVFKRSVENLNEEWLEPANGQFWYNHIIRLPSELRITYILSTLSNQVLNGGLNQYFINGYGQFAYEAILAAKELGIKEVVSILNRALNKLNPDLESEQLFRSKILTGKVEALYSDESLSSYLEGLDVEFHESLEKLEYSLVDYLRRSQI